MQPLWNLEPTNRINFISKLSPTCTLILFILGLKQHLLCQYIHKIKFPWTENSPDIIHKLFILKLDPEPEKLSEHGARYNFNKTEDKPGHIYSYHVYCTYNRNRTELRSL